MRSRGRGPAIFGAVASVAALISTAALWVVVDERLGHLELMASSGRLVDLAEPTIQSFDQSGFLVAELAVKEHLTGVKVSGRMINTRTVDHTGISFSLAIGGQSKRFIINRVSAGNSTGFSVYVPDVPKEDARYGEFAYLESNIHFLTK
jgi:hypothetical protein